MRVSLVRGRVPFSLAGLSQPGPGAGGPGPAPGPAEPRQGKAALSYGDLSGLRKSL